MKTFARKINVKQRMNVKNTSGFGRQHVRLSVPRGTKIRVKRG